MVACCLMQYIRTGITGLEAIWPEGMTSAHVWYLPPIVLVIGLLIGCVSPFAAIPFLIA